MSEQDFDNDYAISFKEYMARKTTREEDWNEIYNSKRISIEALENIEIKKKGRGEDKPIYTDVACLKSGLPYYDKQDLHIHIWKSCKNIPNFESEQNNHVEYIQFGSKKLGTYCSICHKRNLNQQFQWTPRKKSPKYEINYREVKVSEEPLNFNWNYEDPTKNIKLKRLMTNWKRVFDRVFHKLQNKPIEYPLTKNKIIKLWPWQMTSFQKFKLANMNYRDSPIFVRDHQLSGFEDKYAIISTRKKLYS